MAHNVHCLLIHHYHSFYHQNQVLIIQRFSYLTHIFSRNKDKNEALTTLNIVVLIMKILFDLVSRVLIFFVFMIVDSNGEFSPWRTLISFYTMVGIMIVFNMVFNERRNFCSAKYWLGEGQLLLL